MFKIVPDDFVTLLRLVLAALATFFNKLLVVEGGAVANYLVSITALVMITESVVMIPHRLINIGSQKGCLNELPQIILF